MAVILKVDRVRRRGGRGGYHESVGKGSGGGPGRFSREDSRRGSGGSDFEGSSQGGRGSELVTSRR